MRRSNQAPRRARGTAENVLGEAAMAVAQLRERGFAAHEHGDLDVAGRVYREVLRHCAEDFEVMHALGIVEVQCGRYDAAVDLLSGVARRTGSAAAHADWGNALLGLGRCAAALDCYDRAVALQPDLTAAHINRGHALRRLTRREEALASYSRAIAAQPHIVDPYLGRAAVLLESARWAEALESAKTAVALGADSAEAHTVCGLALAGLGHPQAARQRYELALARNAGYVPALVNRGILFRNLKRQQEALASYSKALAMDPQSFEALCNRAIALIELDRFDEALRDCSSAAALRPDHAEVHLHRGAALSGLARHGDALAAYDAALACGADPVRGHQGRAKELLELKRTVEALDAYDRAIGLQPRDARSHLGRGRALLSLERCADARESFERAIALDPRNADAHVGAGMVLAALDRWEEALVSYDRAIELEPGCRDGFVARAAARRRLNLMDGALEDCDRTIALKPDAGAYCNRGAVLTELKRCEAALASFERALALDPQHAAAHFNRSIALLLAGQLEFAWADYEWRWEIKEKVAAVRRAFSAPRWTGQESIAGKSVLLHCEQGLGDTLQFSRYAEALAGLGARVILEVQEPLVSLLGGLAGAAQVLAQGEPLPAFDYWCPLMSVPLALNTSLATIPIAERYLESSAGKVERWRIVLGRSNRPRIGVAWSGSPLHKHDHNRSLVFSTLIDRLPAGFQYVSLQKERRDTDRRDLQAHPDVFDAAPELHDFSDTAALCDCLDLIISVDTSVAHLGGALGRPTWILLPWYPDWRWQLDRDDSPWYPSVKLYRQTTPGDWHGVIERVAADLQRRFASVQA